MAAGTRCDETLKSLGIQMDHVPRPRAPPRFIRPPPPLVMDRPQPIVSDVSLILDSASTSMHSNTLRIESPSTNIHSKLLTTDINSSKERSPNIMNYANYYPTPPQPSNNSSNFELQQSLQSNKTDSGRGISALSVTSEKDDTTVADDSLSSETRNSSTGLQDSRKESMETLKSGIATVLKIVVEQKNSISKLEDQMQQIISFQDRFLSHMLNKSSGISRETQTESSTKKEMEKLVFQRTKSSENLPRGTPSPRGTEPKADGNEVIVRSANVTPTSNATIKDTPKVGRESRIPMSSLGGDKNTEDLSAFLKNIHVGIGQDPSLYSIKSLDVPDYHNDTFQNDSFNGSANIGPSVSAYGSSSEDESEMTEHVKPTKTFYNNLLGTVNRILEGGNGNVNPHTVPTNTRTTSNMKPIAQIPKRSTKTGLVPSPSSRASTGSYTSDLSCGARSERFAFHESCEEKENFQKQTDSNARPICKENNNVVDVTKKYLQTLGVQFDSPVPPNEHAARPPLRGSTLQQQQQNYMIQQNVYNSIYIPTLNCAPVVSDSINSNSGMIDNLAHKYIPSSDLNQYEILQGKKEGTGGTETTVYGMSSNNLSFATKQYLQRYGLVNQPASVEAQPEHLYGQPLRPQVQNMQQAPKSDRILDLTAIRNQPKLL